MAQQGRTGAALATAALGSFLAGSGATLPMAIMIGALVLHGVAPGPNIINAEPALFWGLIASMWIGNLMLLVLNLPLIGVWVRMLAVPYRFLFPIIVALCCIGVYTVGNSTFDVLVMTACAAVGYVLIKLDCEPAPLLLGFVLGPMLEENLRRAMLTGRGDPMVFLTRPISATLLAVAAITLLLIVLPAIRQQRDRAFEE